MINTSTVAHQGRWGVHSITVADLALIPNWQREEKGPHVRWPSLGRNPATGRPWRRMGHLQRTRRGTNLEVVSPLMRNEHGTDGSVYTSLKFARVLLCETRTVV
jgi:hypothetical protein